MSHLGIAGIGVAFPSALKYFLLGAFASGFLLCGIALMYSVAGTTKIPAIAAMISDLRLYGNPVFMVGVAMLLAHREDDGYDIGSFTGIGFRYPVLGGLLALFLVSLAGIAPRSVLAFAERSILSLPM